VKYKVFISYSSEDRPWAEKLYQSLTNRVPKIEVFLDQQGLRAGQKWNPALRAAINDSQHMVVLWSETAKNSEWVTNEHIHFTQKKDQSGDPEIQVGKLIPIWLEGRSAILGDTQGLDELKDFYHPEIAPAVPPDVWKLVIDKLVIELSPATDGIPLWLMLFTLTQAEFDSIDPQYSPNGATPSLKEFLTSIGGDLATVRGRYQTARKAWKPFAGSAETIEEVLENAISTLNADGDVLQRQVAYRWQWVGEDFWSVSNSLALKQSESDIRQTYARQMLVNRALLVIDPIAFYFRNGKFIFEQFADSLLNENAVALVVPPFARDSTLTYLQDVLRYAVTNFSPYFQPPIPAKAFAACALGVSDTQDLQRFLRMTAGRHLRSIEKSTPNPVTNI
jgi:hypothetical protein